MTTSLYSPLAGDDWMMQLPPAERKCVLCRKPVPHDGLCGRCGSVRYCSSACARSDLARHSPQCAWVCKYQLHFATLGMASTYHGARTRLGIRHASEWVPKAFFLEAAVIRFPHLKPVDLLIELGDCCTHVNYDAAFALLLSHADQGCRGCARQAKLYVGDALARMANGTLQHQVEVSPEALDLMRRIDATTTFRDTDVCPAPARQLFELVRKNGGPVWVQSIFDHSNPRLMAAARLALPPSSSNSHAGKQRRLAAAQQRQMMRAAAGGGYESDESAPAARGPPRSESSSMSAEDQAEEFFQMMKARMASQPRDDGDDA